MAASYMDPTSHEERSRSYGRPSEFAILEWNMRAPMTPHRILLSHSEITAFQYRPSSPYLIAGGTFEGQVCYGICGRHR